MNWSCSFLMKITFLIPGFNLAGGTRVIAQHAESLWKRGHEVVVVGLPVQVYSWKARLKSLVRGRGWPAQIRQGPSHFDTLNVNCRVLERHRPITEFDVPDADVVIATWWETAHWAAELPPNKGKKVYFIQGYECNKMISGNRSAEAEATYTLPLTKIVVSRWLQKLMHTRYGDPDVAIVLNSVSHDLFHAPARGKQSRPTVGMMYYQGSLKGTDICLLALEQLKRQLPDLQVVALGTTPPTPSLPLPPGTEFHLSPPQDQIRKIYAQCDAWIVSSRIEGFGLPILEALACRTPVVSTIVGAAEDLIKDGENGYLVPIEDHQAIADRVYRILTLSESHWQQFSDAAYKTASSYTWDEATDQFEAVLKHVVARQSGAASNAVSVDARS